MPFYISAIESPGSFVDNILKTDDLQWQIHLKPTRNLIRTGFACGKCIVEKEG